MKYLIQSIVVLLLMVSCSTSDDPELPSAESVELTFSVDIHENTSVSLLRASSYDDSSIRCVDLLVFDETKSFIQRVQVNAINNTGDSHTFTVRLSPSADPRSIYIVANGRNLSGADIINFNDISEGMSEETVSLILKTSVLNALSSPQCPLVMWGRTDLSSVTPETTVDNVHLIRQVAAMKMECSDPSSDNGLGDFSLKGFSLLQSATFGKVIPNDYNSSNTLPATISLPASIGYADYINLQGDGDWCTALSNKTADIYLYERSNELNNNGLSVIIRALYKGVEGYYKIWLKDGNGQVINPLRNHRYLIRISRVSGGGYSTLQDAVAADYSADIFTEIVDNNDDITDIIVDGKYELGVSSNKVSLNGNGTKNIATVLSTNALVGLTAVSDVEWMTNLAFTAVGNRYTLSGILAATTVARSGNLIVRAGNLVRTITVTQQP